MPAAYAEDPDALKPFDEEGQDGGLASLDVQQAADYLASVGNDTRAKMDAAAPEVDAVSGGAPMEETPAGTPDVAASPDSQQGAPAEGAPAAAPAPGGVDVTNLGVPVNTAPDPNAPPQFDELGPLPQRPVATGDPAADNANLTEYLRALDDRHTELEKRKGALAMFAANVGQQKGKKEAEVAAVTATEAAKVKAAFVAEQKARQAVIDQAVQGRVDAYRDLEGAKWDRPRTGAEIAALIVSGIGAALQNVGAVQAGGSGHAENEAAKAIDARMQRDYVAKKLKLEAAGDAVLAAQYGYKTAGENQRAAMNSLDADQAAKFRLIAKDTEAQLSRAGATKEQIASSLLVTESLQKAAAHEQQINDRERAHQVGEQHAQATEDLARASLGERKTEFGATMGERRQEFALRRADAADARAAREAERRDKADAKKDKDDSTLVIRDGSGVERGYAPSSRVVKPIQDRVIQYDDAIKSAEDLLAYRREHSILGSLPTGDAYDRAVLAVAATTQANASDATTAHEAGTLKKAGLVDEKAIEKTIEHLKERQAAFMKQLRPLEPGEAKAAGRVSLPAPESHAGGDQAKIDRAWKVMEDRKQPQAERQGAKNYLISQGKL